MTLAVTFWGTRGTIPTPGPTTARFGGNTACVSVRNAAGQVLVLDAGTGIRGLGKSLQNLPQERVDVLLSHVHWDHIQGLPFFAPLFASGREVRVHGPAPEGMSLEAVLERQFDAAVFPVPRATRAARTTIEVVVPGDAFEVPGFRVRTQRLSHPGGALGFRVAVDSGDGEIAYVTDNELGAGGTGRVDGGWRADLVDFLRGVPMLIHDAMYDVNEVSGRSGWGHSSALEAVALAAEAGVQQLVLFHHDPDHDDPTIVRLVEAARGAAPPGLLVTAATERSTFSIEAIPTPGAER